MIKIKKYKILKTLDPIIDGLKLEARPVTTVTSDHCDVTSDQTTAD